MRPLLTLAILILLSAGHTLAGPKKNKSDRTNTKNLAKTPEATGAALQLTGTETPAQIAKAYADAISHLLPAPGTNFSDQSLATLEATVHRAARPGAEPERVACSQALAAALSTGITREAKAQLLRQLTNTGGAEVVAIETKLLNDKDPVLREYARAALANNPAITAPPQPTGSEIATAYRLLRDGKPADADAIFRRLSQPAQPRHIRFAALRGSLTVAGDAAAPKILELLSGNDADARAAALGQINDLSPRGRQALLSGLDKLPADIQPVLLDSLASRHDPAVLPVALKLINSPNADLRTTALNTLGRLGDATTVPLLCQALTNAQSPAERATIEGILIQLGGAKATDTALLAALPQATGDTQRSLITILAKRNVQSAVPALLALAKGPDIATGKAALQALGTLATDDDVPAVLGVLADLKVPELRSDAESAGAKALLALDNAAQRTPLLLAALGNPTETDVRRSQLRLLSACGDAKALTIVTTALSDKEPRIREAAVRSLGDWPDFLAWDSLAQIYSQPEKDAYHVLALRGLVRLADRANAHPDATLTDRYRQLLTGAKTDSDRKQILGALSHLATPAALELALPMLTDTGIRAEAELAVKTIADSIKQAHPEAARHALQQLKPAKS